MNEVCSWCRKLSLWRVRRWQRRLRRGSIGRLEGAVGRHSAKRGMGKALHRRRVQSSIQIRNVVSGPFVTEEPR
ncbi:MAG: hypothetical protein D6741_05440 [Planctomycetota bacterium]|nr:MAG: hypothetical protein D6741_05440 [Planctomycetota bacterium]